VTIEHILVRVPIVFPTLAIDKVAKMIFLVWFQCDRGCESAFFRRFIGMVFLFHSFEIANHTNIGCRPDCFLRAGKSDFIARAKPIKRFRRSWLTACVTAKLGTEIRSANGKLIKKIGARIPHDFRRTAVHNLERAGVSRSDAMKMVGHKTESIYRRYAIADERSMKKAAEKLERFHNFDQQAETAK
jgi:hypothetical protein